MPSPMTWHDAVEAVAPHIVRISTPEGSGTGFLFAYSSDRSICGIATARHVVRYAHSWLLPIRIHHYSSGKEAFLKEDDRAILTSEELDSAAIILRADSLPLPGNLLRLGPRDKHFKQGVDLGWVGFPALSHASLCFFRGSVSAFVADKHLYLVDGVAINGVSGAPAFVTVAETLVIAGLISAYVPNRATGEALPGLCMAADISQLQRVVAAMASLHEAKEREAVPILEPEPDPSADHPDA